MELLELVNADVGFDGGMLKCPFHVKEGPPNKLDASPAEDNDTANNSGVLTENLKPKFPLDSDVFVDTSLALAKFREDGPDIGKNVGLKANAHHLIPGHGSLPKSNICKFMGDRENMPQKCKKPSKIEDGGGGIGYDVNGHQNGKWLASNNALRGHWTKDKEIQAEYAFLAINRTQAQFHDAHTDYNRWVKDRLDEVYVKYIMHSFQGCTLEPCKSKGRGSKYPLPPYPHLTRRLNSISRRIAKYLGIGKIEYWDVPDVVTSRFNLIYASIKLDMPPLKTASLAGGLKSPVKVTDHAIEAVHSGATASAR
jgi:hypothetical protein